MKIVPEDEKIKPSQNNHLLRAISIGQNNSIKMVDAGLWLVFNCGSSKRSSVSNGSLAQLVEQRIENPRVLGSIPRRATKYSRV
jgi:hypothetical protein